MMLSYLSKTFSNEKENNIKRKPQIILRLTIALLKSPQIYMKIKYLYSCSDRFNFLLARKKEIMKQSVAI